MEEGWEPLCAFLNVPVPDVPFPRANSKDDYANMLKRCVRVLQLCFCPGAAIPLRNERIELVGTRHPRKAVESQMTFTPPSETFS